MTAEVDGFIARVRAAGAARVVVALQQEWDLTDARGYGPVRRARLLAYAGGELLASDLPGDAIDGEALVGRLRRAGLAVEVRTRNRA